MKHISIPIPNDKLRVISYNIIYLVLGHCFYPAQLTTKVTVFMIRQFNTLAIYSS